MNFLKKNYKFAKKSLFPICRSITGNGIQKSLNLIKKKFPDLKIKKIKSKKKYLIGQFRLNGMLKMHQLQTRMIKR